VQNAVTQGPNGPQPCPSNNAASGYPCEFADGNCFKEGVRNVQINGVETEEFSASTLCLANRYQNGDLDFEGTDYQPNSWPDGSAKHPTYFEVIGPFDAQGQPYPEIQFETDANGSAFLCNTGTGEGCVVPPTSAAFYPFFSLSPFSLAWGKTCAWDFGNVSPKTIEDFGQDAQYGTPNLERYGGTSTSVPMPNPEFSGKCRAFDSEEAATKGIGVLPVGG
jgi:hypothetical protein